MYKYLFLVVAAVVLAGCASASQAFQLSLTYPDKLVKGQEVKLSYDIAYIGAKPLEKTYTVKVLFAEPPKASETVVADLPLQLDASGRLTGEFTWKPIGITQEQGEFVLAIVEPAGNGSFRRVQEQRYPVSFRSDFSGARLILEPAKTTFAYGSSIKIKYGLVNNLDFDMNKDFVLGLYYKPQGKLEFSELAITPVVAATGQTFEQTYTYRVSGIPAVKQPYELFLSLRSVDSADIQGLVSMVVPISFTF
ncbi:MAG: hypothetical protein HY461_01115 [Parcubacteria group bacterium]|nr:hypothetical protein [Parcubacteria group bacterium]